MVRREWRESLGTRDALNISSVAKPDSALHVHWFFRENSTGLASGGIWLTSTKNILWLQTKARGSLFMHHKRQSSFPSRFSGANKVLQLSLQSNRIELGSWFRMEVSSKWKLEVMANKLYSRNNFLKHLSQQVDLRTNTALSNLTHESCRSGTESNHDNAATLP